VLWIFIPGEARPILLLVDWLGDDAVAVPVCCEPLEIEEVEVPGTERA
jgi:hypothetical protein